MSAWITCPQLQPGEHTLFRALANTFSGGWRALGGWVTVTDRRLLFSPHRVDALTGGRPISIDRTAIRRVTVNRPGLHAARQHGPAGLVRRHVEVQHGDGSSFFLVTRPGELLQVLQEPIPR
ncbi:hypothetical protein [Goekera deserti]|nr:hypothetical protein [Goekera deserti]